MTKEKSSGGANLGFEQTLWLAVDRLRGHMDAFPVCHPELVEGSLPKPPFNMNDWGGMFVQSVAWNRLRGNGQ